MHGYNNELAFYPNTEASKTTVEKYKHQLRFYSFNRQMNNITGFKISDDMASVEPVWALDFSDKNQTIFAYKENILEDNERSSEFTISGKTFKKYTERYLLIGTYEGPTRTFMMYYIDSISGDIIYKKKLTNEILAKVPLVSLYDNAAVIAIPSEKEKDEIQLIELFIASEISANSDIPNMERASLAKLTYPIATTLKLDWKMYGANILHMDNVDYIVTINDKNELKMTNIDKLKRGETNTITDENTKEIQLPKDLKFVAPITMSYNEQSRTIFIYGVDAYYHQLK